MRVTVQAAWGKTSDHSAKGLLVLSHAAESDLDMGHPRLVSTPSLRHTARELGFGTGNRR